MTTQLKIIETTKSSKIINVIAWILFIFGFILSFIIDSKTSYRSYIVGTPLIIGLITIYRQKIGSETEQTGLITFSDEFITLKKNNNTIQIQYIDVKFIEVKIVGYYMEVKRNWNVLSKEIFPYDKGIDNKIKILFKDSSEMNSTFLLRNKKEELQLIEILKKYTIENHIMFKIN